MKKKKHSILEKAPPKFYFNQYKSSKKSLNELSGIALLKKLKQFIVETDSKLEKLPVPRNDNAYFQNRNGTRRKPNGSSRLEIVPLNTRTRV